jgi:HK97 family phage portal protein
MALGRALARGVQAALNPLDDRYYQSPGAGLSSAGTYVNSYTALSHSAVWACVRLLAESIAMMPLIMYRRRADGGKDVAIDHPLYDLFHDEPNPLQAAFQWKRMMMVHALLWGNAYSQVLPGPRGAVDQLLPLHPDGVRVDRRPDGTVVYQVHQRDGTTRTLLDDEVFHLTGLSLDGISGLSVMEYAREAIGLGLSARQYQGKFFSNGGRLGGILKVKGRLSKDRKQELRADWQSGHGGSGNAFRVAVMDDDVDWKDVGLNAEDAQLIGSLEWSTADAARYFNVPLHMIGETSKVTSWGSGIAELKDGFVTFSLLPWMANWQDTIRKDLILANRLYFAEYKPEILLRGDTLKRYQAYQLAAGGQAPWLSRNEVRALENMNPVDGLDDMLQPANMTGTSAPPSGGSSDSTSASAEPFLRLFLRDAAARVLRREISAVGKLARRGAGDADALAAAAEEFYAEHTKYVAETLRVSPEAAADYVTEQLQDLRTRGADALDSWETERVDDLVALAIGEPERSLP